MGLRDRNPFPRRDRRKQKGIAMVMAIASLAFITYLAMEVMYEATVEYTVNAQSLNRIKAYYAAKSGLDLSLLRIKIYQNIVHKYGSTPQFEAFRPFVDEIWKFPFMWPMTLPTETSSVDKEAVDKLMKESTFDAAFSTDIVDEGSKIDLGDLVSPSKTLRESTHKRLVTLFKDKVEHDDDFRVKYGTYRFEELVNNIADFMSDKSSSLNGGDKKSAYAELNRDGKEYFPPNRGFRTLQEMRMVKDMTDEFFDILAPQVTIYGMRGINPNVASEAVIRGLDPGIDKRVFDEIEKYRTDPTKPRWSKAEEFWDFVEAAPAAARLVNPDEAKKIPMYFDGLVTFRIRSVGEFASAKREITVIVTDIDHVAKQIKKYVDQDKKTEGGSGTTATGDDPTKGESGGKSGPGGINTKPLPKGPPRIVYWSER